MPIKLYTGTPGAGKTLSALQDALTQVGVDLTNDDPLATWEKGGVPNRPLYFCNFRSLDKRLSTLETPFDWESCIDGSLIVVDEAWEFFGKHLRNADDPRILYLAKHRHRGFDFIFTTQTPGQLTPFVRDLVGSHVHVTRKFGTQTTIRYEWPHIQESPNSQTAKTQAIEQMWTFPQKLFPIYESATLHTVKRRIPPKVLWAIALAAVLPILVLGSAYTLYDGIIAPTQTPQEAVQSPAEARSAASTEAGTATTQTTSDGPITVDQYIMMRTPRVRNDPASAPIYDRFEVQDYPRMLCVIGGDQRFERITCRCRTQQLTPLDIDDRVCIHIARYGYWDPRRPPLTTTVQDQSQTGLPLNSPTNLNQQ